MTFEKFFQEELLFPAMRAVGYMHIYASPICIYIYMYAYTYKYICVLIYIYAYMYGYTYIFTAWIYTYTYIYLCIHIHICKCVYHIFGTNVPSILYLLLRYIFSKERQCKRLLIAGNIYIYIYICVNVCIIIYIYVCKCMYHAYTS